MIEIKDNMFPKIVGYSRSKDDGGKEIDYHLKEYANVVHGSTGNGGNTDQYVCQIEKQPSINLIGQYDSSQNSRVCGTDGISYCVANGHKDGMPKIVTDEQLALDGDCLVDKGGKHYRIRKLTPRECFRLQDVRDADIDTIASYRCDEDGFLRDAHGEPVMNIEFTEPKKNERKVTVEVNGEQRGYWRGQLLWTKKGDAISRSAQYKLAGNSICVAPMYHTFRKLFIEPENENQQLELF